MSMPPSFYEPIPGLGPVATQEPMTKAEHGGPAHSVMLRNCLRTAARAEAELSMQWGLQVKIDEVAILFPHLDPLYKFYEQIHRDHAWHVFNTVEDSGPINSARHHASDSYTYRAGYVFVSHPATHVRLELMTLRDGHSPIHSHLMEDPRAVAGGAVIVHASWKAPTLAAYLSQVRRLEDQNLKVGHEFVSDYGRFGYVGPVVPYLKPRVNLRDQG